MANWIIIIVLAGLVVAGAYALGVYLRRKQDDLPPVRPTAPAKKVVEVSNVPDREVRVVVNWLLSQAFEQTGIRVADDKLAYQRIVEAAQKAVVELKSQNAVEVSLPFLTADTTGPKHLEARLTREMIAELVKY